MSILHIAITDADEDTRQRACEALRAAGIAVYRAWIEPDQIAPGEAVVQGVRYPVTPPQDVRPEA